VYDASRIPEGGTPVHAAGYGCSVRLLRRLVELGGDVRLHDVNGLMVRHWAARQLNVNRRSHNLTYLLYAQNRALTSVGRPPIDVQTSSALPSAQQHPSRKTAAYVTDTHCIVPPSSSSLLSFLADFFNSLQVLGRSAQRHGRI